MLARSNTLFEKFKQDNDQDNRVRPLRFICSMIHSGRIAVHPFVIQRYRDGVQKQECFLASKYLHHEFGMLSV